MSKELYHLVRSLTSSEKRYFKMQASMQVKGKVNNYVRLFNAIASQEAYDEEKLRAVFGKGGALGQYHATKNYLYNLILKSLGNYHSEVSDEMMLNNMMREIEVLFRRGLHDQAMKILKRAEPIAESHNYFDIQLYICRWERRLFYNERKSPVKYNTLELNRQKERAILTQISNQADYMELRHVLYEVHIVQGEFVRTADKEEELRKLLDHPLLRDESAALSFRAKIIFNVLRSSLATALQQQEEGHFFNERIVELYHSNPIFLRENLGDYISMLNNYVYTSSLTRRFDEFRAGLGRMKDLLKQYPDKMYPRLKAKLLSSLYVLELSGLLEEGDLDAAPELVERIEKNLENDSAIQSHIPANVMIYIHSYASHTLFLNSLHKRSLKWINRLLNDSEQVIRIDMLAGARLLNLLLHYELGNYELVEYELTATERFLQKVGMLHKTETIVIKYLKKLLRANANKKEILIALGQELKPMLQDIHEMKVFDYCNIYVWSIMRSSGLSLNEAWLRYLSDSGRLRVE